MNLEKYFMDGVIGWQNETTEGTMSYLISHTEVFNGFDDTVFKKCFMIRYKGIDARKIKRLAFYYNMHGL